MYRNFILLTDYGFTCAYCGKWYGTGSGLCRHKKYSCPFTDKSPVLYCTLCSYSNRRPDNLKSHMKVHFNESGRDATIKRFRKKEDDLSLHDL